MNKTIIKALTFWLPVKKYRKSLRKKIENYYIEKADLKFQKSLLKKLQAKVRNNEKIKVAFFAPDASIWCTDELFELFNKNINIDPYIVIFPYEHQVENLGYGKYEECINFFSKKNFKHIILNSQDMLDYKIIYKKVDADMIFISFTSSLIRIRNIVKAFSYIPKFHIPYGTFLSNLQSAQFNIPILFKNKSYLFWESPLSVEMSKKYSSNKGVNSYYLGYPKLDILLNRNYKPKNVWKKQNKEKKKIIWAPHHSIDINKDYYGYSCFLDLADFMLEVAYNYKDMIQIAFKPHPILKNMLYANPNWGKCKTDSYYNKWNNLSNGQFEPLEYFDLFLTSDAMILDSVSFMCEYSSTLKPALFTIRDETIKHKFNEYGQRVFNEILYKATDLKKDILLFIDNVVLNQEDSLYSIRKNFVEQYMYPPNNKTACKNIYDFVLDIAKKEGLL